MSAGALGCTGTVRTGADAGDTEVVVDGGVESDDDATTVAGDAGTRTNTGGATSLDAGRARADASTKTDGTASDDHGDLVPLFVAVGEMGRTAVSCDDGQSWVADKSDTEAQCSGSDCDHSTSVPTGLAYADGRWFSARGWGYDGPVAYTEDGEQWTKAAIEGRWNGLAAGKDVLFIQGTPNKASEDKGARFEDRPYIDVSDHVRGQVYFLDGKLWVLSDAGDVRMSSDKGRTWRAASSVDERCARQFQPNQGGLAYDGKGVLVVMGWTNGVVCRSTDHGATFSYVTSFGASPSTPLLFADGQFWVWTGNTLRRSNDGNNWSNEPTDARSLMPVARSDQGTWVAADGVYDSQQLLRSKDGLKWEVLDGARFKKSHRLRRIVFGYGKKPGACK